MTRFLRKLAAAVIAAALTLAVTALPAQAITPQGMKDLLSEYYIGTVPQAALDAETVEEIIDALGDPYTMYMNAEEFAQFQATMADSDIVGIGISAVLSDEGLLLLGTYADSPAEKLGLVMGDLILSVAGSDTRDPAELAALLRGEEGTYVTFTVRHVDGTEQTYTAQRAKVIIPATTTQILDDDTTAYISCNNFGEATLGHFVDGTQGYDDVTVWIVDLRNNLGGDVYAATQTLGVFLGRGDMAYLRDGANNYLRYTCEQDRTTLYPAIVLTSPATASSAELFGQVLKDKNGGLVIGSNTYGKGVAQVVLTEEQVPGVLENGEAVRITAFQFYSTSGNTTNHIGVIPDLLVDADHADEIALLFSAVEPKDPTGWIRLNLGGWRWYVELSQAKDPDTAPYFSEMLSAIPPGGQVYLGADGEWTSASVDEIVQVSGIPDFQSRRFTDTEGDSCQYAADTLFTYGILQGMGDGTFRPQSGLTRAQLCALLVQAMGLPDDPGQPPFSDVADNSWYAPYIRAAQAAGYVEGTGNGAFSPEAPVTHEQLITILGRLAAELNMLFHNAALAAPGTYDLPRDYSDWAKPWVWLLAQSQQNILGEPLSMLYAPLEDIDPQASATRGETAQVLYNILYAVSLIPY